MPETASSAASSLSNRSAFEELLQQPDLSARRLSVTSGTVLHEPDSPAQSVYFIHRGQVRKYEVAPDGSNRLLEILGPGEWFGSAALAEFSTYGTRAVAVGATMLTEAPAEKVMTALSRHPERLIEIVKQLAGKLRAAREEASRLVFDDCNARLVKTLIRFSDTAAATRREEDVVLHITH
ncbi:MAG: Crp/Fnr family transcriptional regulator, partial [Tepidisphaeraceae bacterium]